MEAWVNKAKKPTKYTQGVVVIMPNDEKAFPRIYKTSFFPKVEKEPETITEMLLEDNPQVVKKMLVAADFVARLGIMEADVVSVVFKSMVEESIERLAEDPKKAKYFPIKMEDGVYQSFFRDSKNHSGAKGGMIKKANKRPHHDKNEMKDD